MTPICAAATPWLALLLATTSPSEGSAGALPTAEPALPQGLAQRVEVRANTFTWSAQAAVALDQDASGASVLTWHSRRQQGGNYGVYARRLGPLGVPLGDEVQVNQFTLGSQTSPVVALDARGAAWFAWESLGQDGDAGGIFARRFDAELASATVEIMVNAEVAGHQAEVALASDPAGRALVVWTTPHGERGRALVGRLLGPDGRPQGEAFEISGDQRATLPAVVARDGGFAVVWSRAGLDARPNAIRARLLDGDGALLGEEASLYEVDGRQPVEPVLAANARGELVAAWLVAEDEDYVPHARRFAPDGGELGWSAGELLRLDDATPGYTSGLGLDLLDDGGFVLAWTRYDAEQRGGRLLARRVADDGTPGVPFRVCGGDGAAQRLQDGGGARRLIAAADGRLAVAWNGDADSGDGDAANLTLLLPAGLQLAAAAAPPERDMQRFEVEEGAGPHVPPISSGGPVSRDAFLGEAKSLGGPDFGFLGITQTSLTPPDVAMAAGPGHVVEIVNGAIAWFLRDGTFQNQQPIDGGGGFWAPVGANGFIFDPEVIFDPDSRRFMAMANERAGSQAFFLVAVSDDDDPNGTWFKYRFNVTAAAGDTDIDSPNMGVDAQALYLTADFFGPDKYLVYIVEKAPLLSGGAPITKSLLHVGSQSWGIPVMYSSAPAYYMVESFETSTSSTLRLHAITNPLGTPVDTTFDLAVPTYEQPENPPQGGTSVRPETFEARFWSCVFREGKLYATHHTGASRILQRWYEIDMANWPVSGTPTLLQSGDVDPGGDQRTYFGSIGVDGAGNVGLAVAHSSPSTFISMARTWHASGAAAGSTVPLVDTKLSTGPDNSGRWGDYSTCVSDPDFDAVFWGAHEWRGNSGWATWVAAFGPCDAPTTYCTGKVSSLGTTPSIGSLGEPSLGVNAFQLTLTNAVPNNNGIYFFGPGAQATPFFGGTLCVASPITRSGLLTIGPTGSAVAAVPIDVDDLGQDRFFQFWFRDPTHPDGTGVGLSNALSLTFCP